MTQISRCNHAEWIFFEDNMTEDIRHTFEKGLRLLKGGDYSIRGDIVGMRIQQEGRDGGPPPEMEEISFDDLQLKLAVETENGRRLKVSVKSPSGSWDLTSDLVVLLEYLELEPEQIKQLNSPDDHSIPVTFDHDSREYIVDFDAMRDSIFDREDE